MTTKQIDTPPQTGVPLAEGQFVWLSCWSCRVSLSEVSQPSAAQYTSQSCKNCNVTTECHDGIWRALSPQRMQYFSRFITDYEFIRAAEGRGSHSANYYLELPYKDLSGSNSSQWAIRARTYSYIQSHIIPPLAKLHNRPLRILDLGAGNGWMSYRLALLGHLPVAVDLLTNDQDGLGAAIHFSDYIRPLFPRVQAELDNLPFPSHTFDLVIFNASFHYSEDFDRTMAEAFRCTCRGGSILIADSPWYPNEEDGHRMVQEKHRHFSEKYGFSSNSIFNLEYLTPDRLLRLRNQFDAKWETFKPFYGFQWSLRPLRAKLLNRRTPSQFKIYSARVNA